MAAGGQWLEVERREVALAARPSRAGFSRSSGPGQRHDVDRDVPAPLEEVVDEVDQAAVRVMEVLEDHDDRGGRGEPLEERPPGREELL